MVSAHHYEGPRTAAGLARTTTLFSTRVSLHGRRSISENKPRYKSDMVYKWGPDISVRCFGVQGHRLPTSGVEWVGHDIVTEHAVLPSLRQLIHD
jgi:hypothetical protein